MLKTTEAIVGFKVSEKSKENAWKDLVTDVKSNWTKTAYSIEEFFEVAEIEYMEQYHSSDLDVKTKGGRWKTSKYLPNAYKSAKSVIVRAINKGIPLLHTDNTVKGKSAVEMEIGSVRVINVSTMIHKHVSALKHVADNGFSNEVTDKLNEVFGKHWGK